MGGEGSMLHAIKSLKNNRALVKKRKSRSHSDLLLDGNSKTQVEFKKVSPQELERIKDEIRKEARRGRLKELVICILVFGIILGWIFWLTNTS